MTSTFSCRSQKILQRSILLSFSCHKKLCVAPCYLAEPRTSEHLVRPNYWGRHSEHLCVATNVGLMMMISRRSWKLSTARKIERKPF